MSNRGKTAISCTLYINNILCVRVDLSNPKQLHCKQQFIYFKFNKINLLIKNRPSKKGQTRIVLNFFLNLIRPNLGIY